MDLDAYLARIGWTGPRTPTLATLAGVHRAHALAIPYENLDVQLCTPVHMDPARIAGKVVGAGRGGWCYEMNGLLGGALAALGFTVQRVVGGVMRAGFGDGAWGNHLVLLVAIDGEQWVADVGLGDGFPEPFRLREGPIEQGFRRGRVERLGADEWRVHNRPGGTPPSFDILARPADEGLLADTCQRLQDDPESMFRQNLVCQRMAADGVTLLLGRVLRHEPAGERRLLASAAELDAVLRDAFGLAVPGVGRLWPQVVARHATLFGDTPVDDLQFGPPQAADA